MSYEDLAQRALVAAAAKDDPALQTGLLPSTEELARRARELEEYCAFKRQKLTRAAAQVVDRVLVLGESPPDWSTAKEISDPDLKKHVHYPDNDVLYTKVIEVSLRAWPMLPGDDEPDVSVLDGHSWQPLTLANFGRALCSYQHANYREPDAIPSCRPNPRYFYNSRYERSYDGTFHTVTCSGCTFTVTWFDLSR